MRPIDPDHFRRLAMLLAAGASTACGGAAATAPRHTDPTMGSTNPGAPVVEGYAAATTGYCDYATGTYYDPTGEAWWNGGPDGTCYAPTGEGSYDPTGEGYYDPTGESYPPVYEG